MWLEFSNVIHRTRGMCLNHGSIETSVASSWRPLSSQTSALSFDAITMSDSKNASQPNGQQAKEQPAPAAPALRRGAVSVQSRSEYEKLQPYQNDKDKLLQYKVINQGPKKTRPENKGPKETRL
ncbi:5b88844f-c957-4c75-94c8-4f0db14d7f49 [Thermothielavioides terrestris]|uniref:5b88844f-c957-4c75-94c8-4f0db14d7f49 n=1 Tax=Thermothielavioides terrestris TaxID=2587410 RepID=A0A3S4B2D4_9PEZI|nr:5b88844f-c957-4c75-94c8-4f0db14d7f49 [Thermothielavioides terrestris]